MLFLVFYLIIVIFVLYNLTVLIYNTLNNKWREGNNCNKKNCKCSNSV